MIPKRPLPNSTQLIALVLITSLFLAIVINIVPRIAAAPVTKPFTFANTQNP